MKIYLNIVPMSGTLNILLSPEERWMPFKEEEVIDAITAFWTVDRHEIQKLIPTRKGGFEIKIESNPMSISNTFFVYVNWRE